jgi:AcrR family transcriptional regulator
MARADREQQMLAQAEAVFAERGYRDASMEEIAERVGVSKPMLYAYFGSKDRLLLACIAKARAELLEVTSQALAEADGPRDGLRRGLVAHFSYIDAHTQTWAMLRNEGAAVGAVADEIEAIRRQQTRLIAEACRGFAPAADPTLVEVYAEMVVGATERVSLWREQHRATSPEQTAEHMVTVIWSGLAALLGEPALRT